MGSIFMYFPYVQFDLRYFIHDGYFKINCWTISIMPKSVISTAQPSLLILIFQPIWRQIQNRFLRNRINFKNSNIIWMYLVYQNTFIIISTWTTRCHNIPINNNSILGIIKVFVQFFLEGRITGNLLTFTNTMR